LFYFPSPLLPFFPKDLFLLHLATITATLLALLTAAAAAAAGVGAGAGRGAGRRPGGISSLMTCSDPKKVIYTDSTQPGRIKKYIYIFQLSAVTLQGKER
jgi:hypothetical protein